jgi:hypothetical protein
MAQSELSRLGRSMLECIEILAIATEKGLHNKRKDQVMTVFKVALANLVMWTRDQYFQSRIILRLEA